jgi:hypothetical protein
MNEDRPNVKENPLRALAMLCGLPRPASRSHRRGHKLGAETKVKGKAKP